MSRTKSIPGFSGYRVDTEGNVYGKRGQCMSKVNSHDGYVRVGIFNNDGIRKTIKIHRLVLLAFVGPCPDGCEGRHLNGDGRDNRLENLAWGTRAENGTDKRSHGRSYNVGNEHGATGDIEETKRIVVEMRSRAASGESVRSFHEEYGMTYAYARKVVNGGVWSKLPGAIRRSTRGKIIRP